jgi:hypothetical protein
VNLWTLGIFSGILILVGVLGFVVPADKAMTSGEAPYNIFHLCFGALGFILLATQSVGAAMAFNIGFGSIDLYQALASRMSWFPKQRFQWTKVDDLLHIVVGAALVVIGIVGS